MINLEKQKENFKNHVATLTDYGNIKIIVRNKCCNECRIYNWGHIMYLTPLIFIKSFWTYSLVVVGIFLFIQWEYMNLKHPERFSPISNKTLRCGNCNHDCRYNKNKKDKQKYKQVA